MEVKTLAAKCQEIRKQLIEFLKRKQSIPYNANEFLNKDPLAPMIGTVCDQQISADVAWEIPYHLATWLRQQGITFKASGVRSLGQQKLRSWLNEHMRNRWPSKMTIEEREKWLDNISRYIIHTCEKTSELYGDDPDSIFIINNGILSIPLIYFILRQFDGIGPKKASMIARDFGRGCNWLRSINFRLKSKGIKLKVKDVHFTEIPIDFHVKKVFRRIGFLRYNQPQDFQNIARLIYPENPGLVDDLIWIIGREICKPKPNCEECPLSEICEYYSRRR